MRVIEGNVRDWISAGERLGLNLTFLDSDKSEDMRRLRESGLPIFEDYSCSYREFRRNNKKLMEYLDRTPCLVVRAIPVSSRTDLPRKPAMGLHGYEETKRFLDHAVRGNERDYRVIISPKEEEKASGIIHLGELFSLVGVSGVSLADFSHGNVQFNQMLEGVFIRHWNNRFTLDRHLRELTEPRDKEFESIMRQALFCVTKAELDAQEAYLEFVVSDRMGIRFIDYKDNKNYGKGIENLAGR